MLQVFADAKKLKALAEAFLHPEKSFRSSVGARCYFDRFSSPEVIARDEAEEEARILAETLKLKQISVDHLHPEVRVTTTDETACGRNYFTRFSAPEVESEEEESAQVLAETATLKKIAVDYMHPENTVKTTDPTVFGRNYFNRASALDIDDEDDAEERSQVLAETAALKKLAVDYMHPEIDLKTTDHALFGRNYFNRASAPDTEDEDDSEDRILALAEAAGLMKLAVDYMHPEICVKTIDANIFLIALQLGIK